MRNQITIQKRTHNLNRDNYANFELWNPKGKGCLISVTNLKTAKGKPPTVINIFRIDKGVKVFVAREREAY